MSQPPATRQITEQEEAFAVSFARNGGNATQAAVEAGYSERTARQQGSRLKARPVVQQRIAQESYALLAETVPLAMAVQRELLTSARSAMVKAMVADSVLDRVLGKAVQRQETHTTGELTVRIDLS